MGVGGLFFAIVSLLGLHGLLLAVPSLYWALEVPGGSYPGGLIPCVPGHEDLAGRQKAAVDQAAVPQRVQRHARAAGIAYRSWLTGSAPGAAPS